MQPKLVRAIFFIRKKGTQTFIKIGPKNYMHIWYLKFYSKDEHRLYTIFDFECPKYALKEHKKCTKVAIIMRKCTTIALKVQNR